MDGGEGTGSGGVRDVDGWIDGGRMVGWVRLFEVDFGWVERRTEEDDRMVPHDDEWADRDRAKDTPGAAMR